MRILVFLIIFSSSSLIAQQVPNLWYFGDGAAIEFKGDSIINISGSKLYTDEGCSVAMNNKGGLLFYTDGVEIYNKNNQRMPYGFGLKSHESSTQSVLSIPDPKDPYTYHIFTVDEAGIASPPNEGLNYSIIDLKQERGLGDVKLRRKNIQLLSNTVEKLTAIQDEESGTIWIITHLWASDTFAIFRFSENGLDYKPIFQKIGVSHGSNEDYRKINATGYMKASPKGDKLAVSIRSKGIELFDFDSRSGTIRHPIRLNIKEDVYGIEFSPNGEFLYTSTIGDSLKLYQFQVNRNLQEVIASKVILAKEGGSGGALQLGPDGQIYVARYNSLYLDKIMYPNKKGGEATFIKNAIYLAGKKCRLGLPNHAWVGFCHYPSAYLGQDTVLCNGELLFLSPDTSGLVSWKWNDNTQDSLKVIINAGTYGITVKGINCSNYDEIDVKVIQNCKRKYNVPIKITPNNDGFNDSISFMPSLTNENLIIYSQSFECVFECNQPLRSFYPEGFQDGIYYYRITTARKEEVWGWFQITHP